MRHRSSSASDNSLVSYRTGVVVRYQRSVFWGDWCGRSKRAGTGKHIEDVHTGTRNCFQIVRIWRALTLFVLKLRLFLDAASRTKLSLVHTQSLPFLAQPLSQITQLGILKTT